MNQIEPQSRHQPVTTHHAQQHAPAVAQQTGCFAGLPKISCFLLNFIVKQLASYKQAVLHSSAELLLTLFFFKRVVLHGSAEFYSLVCVYVQVHTLLLMKIRDNDGLNHH